MAYTRDQDFCVIAKWNDSTAADDKEVTKSTLLGGKIYFATNKVTDFIADPRASGIYYNDELFRKKSIYQVVIDLEPDYSSSFGTLSKASHLSGGILNYYDGSNPYESSFFINPEYIDLSVVYAATGHRRNEIIIQNQGTVSTTERFYVLTKNGAACLAGPTYYWTFYTTTTTISVSYRIDGVGTAGGPGVQVLVDINSYDSAYSVALKTFNALNAVASSYAFTISISADRGNVSYGPQLYIQNTINGAVTDATNANFALDPGNSFAGSTDEIFTYCFLWKFYDVHGQLMYSAPSLPRQIKFTAAVGFTFITGYIPNLTNKDISKVIIDIYRTTNNIYALKVRSLITAGEFLVDAFVTIQNYRECKSLVAQIQKILKLISRSIPNRPTISRGLVGLANYLPGTSPERAVINTIEIMQGFGLPTGALADGQPNKMILYQIATQRGAKQEEAENGVVDIGIDPITSLPVGKNR